MFSQMQFRLTATALVVCAALTPCGCRSAKRQEKAVSRIDWNGADPSARIRRGIVPGTGNWRWTSPVFAVALDAPPASARPAVELDFNYPVELASVRPAVTIAVRANGEEICRKPFGEGRHEISCPIPEKALTRQPVEVEFDTGSPSRNPESGAEAGLIAVAMQIVEETESAPFREREMAQARESHTKTLERFHSEIPAAEARQMQALFHRMPAWDSLWFQNVRIIKNPLDLWMMQQLIYETRPDLIVETGTWHGGSALFWAYVLNGMGFTGSRVITIDIQDLNQTASASPLWKQYVRFLLGSSTDPAIVGEVTKAAKNRKVLVMLDSDHSRRHVLNELKAYAPLVSKGGYLIVEDTHLDGIPTHPEQGPGPMAAVTEFLKSAEGREFEPDASREGLLMTFNPGGWLKRR